MMIPRRLLVREAVLEVRAALNEMFKGIE